METLQPQLTRLKEFYSWSLTVADPRVESWLLMSSPWPTLILTFCYLLMVTYGPRYMSNRKPFSLKWVMVTYNFAMTILNLYIGYELVISSTARGYNYLCQPVDYSNNEYEVRIAKALWWYYFSRLVEMSDSLIFVLRKKTNQLTFLHIYHHSTMFVLWWIGIKWVAGGSSFLAAMVNSFIHVFMYAYYGLSAFGPKIQKYLWWKKYLTILQLAQFTSAMVLGIRAIIVGCDFPLWMQYALVVYMMSFLVLFGNFYRKAYGNRLSSQNRSTAHVSRSRQPNRQREVNGHALQNGTKFESPKQNSGGPYSRKRKQGKDKEANDKTKNNKKK